MSLQKLKTRVGLGKITIVILGVICMGVGLHSHFQSDWSAKLFQFNIHGPTFELYKLCDFLENPSIKCPKIAMEQYFVGITIVCFILSLASLAVFLFSDTSSGNAKIIDLVYHILSAVLLMVGAIVYMISAEQIDDLKLATTDGTEITLLRGEKLVAGILTVFQALLYSVVGFLIIKEPASIMG